MEEQKQEASEDVDMVDTSQLATSNGAGDLSPGGPDNSLSPGGPDNSLSPGGAGNSISPGGAGNSIPPGGAGNSIPPGGADKSISPGGAGNSIPPGGADNSIPPGGAGNSIPPGGAGNSSSRGGAANSLLSGGADKRQGESAMEPNSKDDNFSSGPAPDVNMNGGDPVSGPAPDVNMNEEDPVSGPAPDVNMNEEDPVSGPAPDVNMNEEDPVSGPALAGASCPTTSSEQYAPGGKTQEPPELSQKPGSQDRAGTAGGGSAGGGGAEAVVGGSSREEKQPGQNTEITKRQKMKEIGIFLTDFNTQVSWLTDNMSKIPADISITFLPISAVSWEDVIDRNYIYIICHSMRSQVSQDVLQSHLDHIIKRSQPVKVLITDVTDKDSEMKRFWASQTETNKWESLSFTEAELDFIKADRLKPWTDRDTESKLKRMRDILRYIWSAYFRTKFTQKVGIFSRSAEEEYSWLQTLLSEGFRDCVQEVRPYYISNSGYRQFRQDVSECTFGILYHTKNRGRINVTDVEGSLYDKELKYLSDTLGKDKVIVVVDDLDDNSKEMKDRILQNQPSIGKLAQDLFLFRTEEKGEWMKYLPALQPVDEKQLRKKLNTVKDWIRLGEPSYLKAENVCGDNKGFSSAITSFFKGVSNPLNKLKTPEGKHTVGIFSRSAEEKYSWLQILLRSQRFRDCVQEVRPCYISNNHQEFTQNVSQCTFGILYHSMNKERSYVTESMNYLMNLSSTFGRDKVIVVVDDLDDDSLDEKHRILQGQPSIRTLAQELILFNRQEKIHSDGRPRSQNVREKLQTIEEIIQAADKRIRPSDQSHGFSSAFTSFFKEPTGEPSYLKAQKVCDDIKAPQKGQIKSHRRKKTSNEPTGEPSYLKAQKVCDDIKGSQNPRNHSSSTNPLQGFVSEKYRVGIFSRSSEEEYSWLQNLLGSKGFRDQVQEVRPCYISNSGYRQFTQDVSQCTFGILYHTKNRGRINITDVTDSLYDKELKYLSEKLGKKKVVVVIDDLEDSGSEQKNRILANQPSIGRLAQNLILIGSKDKMSKKKDIISHRDLFVNSM